MFAIPGYQLLEELASGASGTVYRARQTALGREVALKLLAPGLFGAEETRARFVREAKLQARLNHPNLLRVYDSGFLGERPYLVMELMTGGSIRELLRDGPLSIVEAVRLGHELTLGLAQAHAAGIIHRDLKPENALLTPDGQVKLADFGLAKAAGALQTVQTEAGVVMGTPGYMAPEVIQGEPAGQAADLYALGVILHEMLAGTRPFDGEDVAQLFRAQLEERSVPLRALRPEVPAELAELILSCLRARPEDRPASAEELTQALERISESRTDGSSPAPTVAGGLDRRKTIVRRAGLTTAPAETMRRRGSGQGTATVARGPAAPAPASATAARVAAGFVAVCIVSALMASLSRPRATEPAAARSLAQASGHAGPQPVPASGPLPGPRPAASAGNPGRLFRGSDRVRFAFDRPPATAVQLIAEPEDVRSARVRMTGEAGGSSILVEGLRAGIGYRAELRGDGVTSTFRFRTLGADAGGRVAVVHPTERKTEGLAVERWEHHLFAVWREELANSEHLVGFAESLDGGETWSSPETLNATGSWASLPALAVSRGRVAVTWLTGETAAATVWTRVRDASGRGWLPAQPVLEALNWPPELHEAPDGGFEVGAFLKPGWFTLRGLGPDGVASETATRAFAVASPPRQCRVLRSGTRKFVVMRLGLTRGSRLFWSATRPDAPRNWLPLQPLTPESEDPDDVCAAAAANRIVVAYKEGEHPRVRLFDEALNPLPNRVEPFRDLDRMKIPSVARLGDDVYLACIDLGAFNTRNDLAFARSADGLTWTREGGVALPLVRLRSLRLTTGRGCLVALMNTTQGTILTTRFTPRRGR